MNTITYPAILISPLYPIPSKLVSTEKGKLSSESDSSEYVILPLALFGGSISVALTVKTKRKN